MNSRLSRYLEELVERGGSDLHVGDGLPAAVRTSGAFVALEEQPPARADVEAMLLEPLDDRAREALARDLAVSFVHEQGTRARFRASYAQGAHGLSAVFRPLAKKIPSPARLGIPESARALVERSSGLLLVASPRASGRSTTIASLVEETCTTRGGVAVLVGDGGASFSPKRAGVVIERTVGCSVPSVAAALRSAADGDVDCIGVGLAGADELELALALASSGVLVIAGVEAPTAAAAIDLAASWTTPDQRADAYKRLAATLVGVLAQRLVRTTSGASRAPAFEVLVCLGALAALVRDGKTARLPAAMHANASLGMQTMDHALEELVRKGTVARERALLQAVDRPALEAALSR